VLAEKSEPVVGIERSAMRRLVFAETNYRNNAMKRSYAYFI
jgi:hypothetical protein